MDRTSGANPWNDDGSCACRRCCTAPVGCGGEKIGRGPIRRGITTPTILQIQWAIVDWRVSRHGGLRIRGFVQQVERDPCLSLSSFSFSFRPLLAKYTRRRQRGREAWVRLTRGLSRLRRLSDLSAFRFGGQPRASGSLIRPRRQW